MASNLAVDNLRRDHDRILEVLDALDAAIRRALGEDRLDLDQIDRITSFIEVHADGIHYRKEEQVLFPELERIGIPEQGPIRCLLMEHDATRGSARAMAESLAKLRGGDESAKPELLRAAIQYTSVTRLHVAKENAGLFPMAAQLLTPESDERMLVELERIDAEGLSMEEAAAKIREPKPSPPAIDPLLDALGRTEAELARALESLRL